MRCGIKIVEGLDGRHYLMGVDFKSAEAVRDLADALGLPLHCCGGYENAVRIDVVGADSA